jgi:hypothetical protein
MVNYGPTKQAAEKVLLPTASSTACRDRRGRRGGIVPLFEDSFVCVADRKLKRGKGAINMNEYLSFRHVSIETQPNQQNLIDRSLACFDSF